MTSAETSATDVVSPGQIVTSVQPFARSVSGVVCLDILDGCVSPDLWTSYIGGPNRRNSVLETNAGWRNSFKEKV